MSSGPDGASWRDAGRDRCRPRDLRPGSLSPRARSLAPDDRPKAGRPRRRRRPEALVKLYPLGGGIRDAAQARYIAAFVARVGRPWRVTLEAPVPIAGDLRAVDVLLASERARIAVEVITRLADLQAQVRAAQLKARDIGATRLILVIAAPTPTAPRWRLPDRRSWLPSTWTLDA